MRRRCKNVAATRRRAKAHLRRSTTLGPCSSRARRCWPWALACLLLLKLLLWMLWMLWMLRMLRTLPVLWCHLHLSHLLIEHGTLSEGTALLLVRCTNGTTKVSSVLARVQYGSVATQRHIRSSRRDSLPIILCSGACLASASRAMRIRASISRASFCMCSFAICFERCSQLSSVIGVEPPAFVGLVSRSARSRRCKKASSSEMREEGRRGCELAVGPPKIPPGTELAPIRETYAGRCCEPSMAEFAEDSTFQCV